MKVLVFYSDCFIESKVYFDNLPKIRKIKERRDAQCTNPIKQDDSLYIGLQRAKI